MMHDDMITKVNDDEDNAPAAESAGIVTLYRTIDLTTKKMRIELKWTSVLKILVVQGAAAARARGRQSSPHLLVTLHIAGVPTPLES